MSRKMSFLILFVVFAFFVSPVAAELGKPPTIPVETEDYGIVTAINDGRLNGLDVGAPVVIYNTHMVMTDPKDGHTYEADDAYELLAVDRLSNNGYLVLRADADSIRDLMTGEIPVIESNGYSLGYSPSDYFWVTSPPDFEGKVYTFQWQNHEFPMPQ